MIYVYVLLTRTALNIGYFKAYHVAPDEDRLLACLQVLLELNLIQINI